MFKTPASIFAALGIACVVIGFSVWGYLQYRTEEVQVSKINSTNPANRGYEFKITSTSWQDTGVWVKSGQFVYVYGEVDGQPFEISTDSATVPATMDKNNQFLAKIIFSPYQVTDSGPGYAVASVKEQEKLFVRLHNAATKPITATAVVAGLDEEWHTLLKTEAESQWSTERKWVWILFGVVIFVGICAALGWFGAKWEDG